MPLYTNEYSGVIACFQHIGMYAQAAINRRPTSFRWRTPLGDWRRWTEHDDAEWVREFGRPAVCEHCPKEGT